MGPAGLGGSFEMNMFHKFFRLREAYRAVFQRGGREPEQAKDILEDLREFCRADSSCIVVAKDGRIDTHATAVAEGRRETYLRIMQMINITDEQLKKMEGMENE